MPKLSVNVDHVATLRQARKGKNPDPVAAAFIAEMAGADGIIIHLREDRRHIQDRDLEILRQTVKTKLNLEMANTEEIIQIALRIKPDMVTFVPERRQELTTEGGLDVRGNQKLLKKNIQRLKKAGILSSLFIDANPLQDCRNSAAAGAATSTCACRSRCRREFRRQSGSSTNGCARWESDAGVKVAEPEREPTIRARANAQP